MRSNDVITSGKIIMKKKKNQRLGIVYCYIFGKTDEIFLQESRIVFSPRRKNMHTWVLKTYNH